MACCVAFHSHDAVGGATQASQKHIVIERNMVAGSGSPPMCHHASSFFIVINSCPEGIPLMYSPRNHQPSFKQATFNFHYTGDFKV